MILSFVKKYGVKKFTFGITILSAVFSVIVTSISLQIFQGYIDELGVIIAIAAPVILLPIPAGHCFRTILKLDYTESQLTKKNVALGKAIAEVKKLSGLLPICANCKKIRSSNGLWNDVEIYIRDNSEVEFSHSLCPACTEKLYPGFMPSEKNEPAPGKHPG